MAATAWWTSAKIPDGLSDLNPAPVAVDVEVVSGIIDFGAPATLSAQFTAREPLLASGLGGTVTEVLVAPGQSVSSLDDLYRVDGVLVRAYEGAVLFRPLGKGAKGPDVAAAQLLLAAALPGTAVPQSGVMDAATMRAVGQYAAQIGVSPKPEALQPSWFVHLPAGDYPVAEVLVKAAAPVPSAGQEIAKAETATSRLEVVSDTRGPDGDYVLVVSGRSIPLLRKAAVWEFADEADAVELLRAQAVAADTPSGATVTGRTRLAEPLSGLAVPGSALLVGQLGQTCLAPSTGEPRAVPVEVVGTAVDGTAQLASGVEAGDMVWLDPLSVAPGLTCP